MAEKIVGILLYLAFELMILSISNEPREDDTYICH